MLTCSPLQLNRMRKQRLVEIAEVKRGLAKDERALHESMAPHIQQIMAGNPMRKLGYEEEWMITGIVEGFPISGDLPESCLFPANHIPAQFSRDRLLAEASWRRRALLGKIRSSGDPEMDKMLVEKTWDEKSGGSMLGPFTDDELSRLVGGSWVPARRFGILQSSADGVKLRPIDDYTVNGQNST
eukprot:6462259-Amphidinium_carterae.1